MTTMANSLLAMMCATVQVPLGGFGRYEGPFVQAEFPAPDIMSVSHGKYRVTMDFASGASETVREARCARRGRRYFETTSACMIP